MFSIAGEGLCVGRDSGEPVTGDYPGEHPYPFTGGTIRRVGVDVSGKPYIDLEREAAAMLARELGAVAFPGHCRLDRLLAETRTWPQALSPALIACSRRPGWVVRDCRQRVRVKGCRGLATGRKGEADDPGRCGSGCASKGGGRDRTCGCTGVKGTAGCPVNDRELPCVTS